MWTNKLDKNDFKGIMYKTLELQLEISKLGLRLAILTKRSS